MTGITTTTYAEYLLPGIMVPESSRLPVTSRDPDDTARRAGPDVYAFRFYDTITTAVTVAGKTTELRSDPVNASGWYYIDAETLTATDVERLPGNHEILLANMRGNGWDPVLRCRAGNFVPLRPGDTIVSSGSGK